VTPAKATRTFGGAIVLGGAIAACGNVYADPVTRSSSSITPGVDSGVSAPRQPGIPCPSSTASLENTPCPSAGGVCEYGSSPDPSCNTTFRCVNDAEFGLYFTEQESRTTCAFTCPADPSEIVDGAPCDLAKYGDGGAGDEEELQCTTALGTCACTTGPDGAHFHERRWVCKKTENCCPTERPHLGQICVGDHSCDYGACDFKRGSRMQCLDETWQIEASPCK
jgi:hypothetical protein